MPRERIEVAGVLEGSGRAQAEHAVQPTLQDLNARRTLANSQTMIGPANAVRRKGSVALVDTVNGIVM